ncbi:MAG: hypothetical protein Ct9H90mP16_08280 [Candidatus Poseidoniales archaeon]|nr:MAG: hypothetical protein Ct9H90mP16_08280 [Candidatus Poseidoniales archaeon]
MEAQGVDNIDAVKARFAAASQGANDFLKPDGVVNRARAGLLFIESYRELPLLAWPRVLIDAVVELEERWYCSEHITHEWWNESLVVE